MVKEKEPEQLMKSQKIRIYPSQRQKEIIRNNFNCCKFVYNVYLNMLQANYIQGTKYLKGHEKQMTEDEVKAFKKKMFPSRFDLIKMLPKLKKQYKWLKTGESTSLQYTVTHLYIAYQRFFKKLGKKPKRKNAVSSYTGSLPSDKLGFIDFQKHLIKIPKTGNIFFNRNTHIKLDNPLSIQNFTISEDNLHDFYISLVYNYKLKPEVNTSFSSMVGVDLGISSLITLSNGIKLPYIDFNKMTFKLHKQLKIMSRKQLIAKDFIKEYNDKHSNDTSALLTLEDCSSYQKQKHIVAKSLKKIARKRKYYLDSLTNYLVDTYDFIAIEDVKSAKLMKNKYLSKYIGNASWNTIKTMLQYKCIERGIEMILVPPVNTNRTCSNCGFKSNKKIVNKTWTCSNCNMKLDKYINSAKNVLNFGLEQLKKQN